VSEVAPAWALCSDCRIVGAKTCLDVTPCWAPMRTEDLPAEPPGVTHVCDCTEPRCTHPRGDQLTLPV
jgi:hypothetical protein